MRNDLVITLRLAADPDGNVCNLDDLMFAAADEIEQLRRKLADQTHAMEWYEYERLISGKTHEVNECEHCNYWNRRCGDLHEKNRRLAAEIEQLRSAITQAIKVAEKDD